MTFAAFYTAFRSIQSITNENKSIGDILGNTAFAQIVLSLLGTFGIYILASVIVRSFLPLLRLSGYGSAN
jgi:hypothetical protein